MSGISTAAGRRHVIDADLFGWWSHHNRPVDHQGLKQRLAKMSLRRAAREEAGTVSCPNLYRLTARRKLRGQRNLEQWALGHWFAARGTEYIPQVKHMLSPVRTAEDELAQVHLSGCLIRNPVVVGLEHDCKHGTMVAAI